ncbi:MAG: prenyltransferase/squalene oxidase repeat-containing protein [Promethearchaeota archaeon]
MRSYKYRNITIVILVLIFTFTIIPNALGKTRQNYLTDFIYENEINGRGFKNDINAGNRLADVSPQATANALDILDRYGMGVHELTELQSVLEDFIETMFKDDTVSLYDLYYLLKALGNNIIDYSIEDSMKNEIRQYLNATEQPNGGFSISNVSTSTSLSSTYFAYKIFSLVSPHQPLQNISKHINWIKSCNNSDGGYGGNSSLSSSILNTYYAVSLLHEIATIDDLADKNQTLSYLNSYFVNNPSDTKNFGGYLPDLTSQYTLISSTYYCVITISIIDETILNAKQTTSWVLSRQYFGDGGFAEKTAEADELSSSVILSFYAFEILRAFNSLNSLNVEIWMVEFNYTILYIIFGCIGVIAAISIFIWRRRRI